MSQYKPSTVRAAASHLRNHILPQLGKLRLDEIGNERQQSFITSLSQKASRKTVLNVTSTLSSMFHRARRWGYICEKVDMSELVLPKEDLRSEARSSHRTRCERSSPRLTSRSERCSPPSR